MFNYERQEMYQLKAKNNYLQSLVQTISNFYEELLDKYITDEKIRKDITSKLIKAISKVSILEECE